MHRYRFPIAILILSALTFGLFITASPTNTTQAAPRSIPWDCSDWQESPAVEDAGRCPASPLSSNPSPPTAAKPSTAPSTSPTPSPKLKPGPPAATATNATTPSISAKAATSRGFLAAQEGYLTDGESGVTGVSRDLIFEFPREQRRGKKTITKRRVVPHDDSRRLRTPQTATHAPAPDFPEAQRRARVEFGNNPPSGFAPAQAAATWQALAETAAAAYCTNARYQRTVGVSTSDDIWEYTGDQNPHPQGVNVLANKARTWTATCEKKVRVRRR